MIHPLTGDRGEVLGAAGGAQPAARRVGGAAGGAGPAHRPALLPARRQAAARPLRRAGGRAQYVHPSNIYSTWRCR